METEVIQMPGKYEIEFSSTGHVMGFGKKVIEEKKKEETLKMETEIAAAKSKITIIPRCWCCNTSIDIVMLVKRGPNTLKPFGRFYCPACMEEDVLGWSLMRAEYVMKLKIPKVEPPPPVLIGVKAEYFQ